MLLTHRLALFPLILARERLARGPRPRVPEPMVMDEAQAAEEYDRAGAAVQVPVHHFNARALSRLLPDDGTLVDLGCGSGRLLARLAKGRPDARLIGLDLSEPMLAAGRRLLEAVGLAGRGELRRGDITTWDTEVAERADVVSCNFTLHQLPDEALVDACLGAVARAREATGCAVHLFDLVRLRHARTWPDLVSAVELPGPVFHADTIASERAAFTFEELRDRIRQAGLTDLEHLRSRPLGEYQVHRAPSRSGGTPGRWHDVPLPPGTELLTKLTAGGFPRAILG